MKIAAKYSHLNGYEWLMHHRPDLWDDLEDAITSIDAETCRTKRSKEKTMKGKLLYSPADLNRQFKEVLYERGWECPGKTFFYATDDEELTKRLISSELDHQREILEANDKPLIRSYNEADFAQDRIALEVQFGKYSFVQFDIFIKHAAEYMQDKIDLGIEIVPTKAMEREMSSGPPYYEKHLHELLRQGRIFPPVPLILIGVEP